jgi:hypothetical protein
MSRLTLLAMLLILVGCERPPPAPAVPVPDVPVTGQLSDIARYTLPDGVVCYQYRYSYHSLSCLQVRP